LKDPKAFIARIKQLYIDIAEHSFDTLEFTDGRVYERYSQPQWIENVPVGRVWSFRDVTERVKSAKEIERINANLEQRVYERTAQLEASNKELEAFSYSVSHDLRTPLRSLDGWSQVLIEDYANVLDETGRHHLDRIRYEAQHMGELIDALLQLSRTAKIEMKVSEQNLSSIAQAIAKRLQEEQPTREAEFIIQPNLLCIADSHLIDVVMVNLLENAWKFTNKTPKAVIEIGSKIIENQVTYYVSDNGAGFNMAYSNKLFGTFQRLHSPKEFEGTGIGLATVKRIINRHGGKIWAESIINEGATFFFTL
jgi:light-regulated signal transduction histidine kinase (bacteriophytochrome)